MFYKFEKGAYPKHSHTFFLISLLFNRLFLTFIKSKMKFLCLNSSSLLIHSCIQNKITELSTSPSLKSLHRLTWSVTVLFIRFIVTVIDAIAHRGLWDAGQVGHAVELCVPTPMLLHHWNGKSGKTIIHHRGKSQVLKDKKNFWTPNPLFPASKLSSLVLSNKYMKGKCVCVWGGGGVEGVVGGGAKVKEIAPTHIEFLLFSGVF